MPEVRPDRVRETLDLVVDKFIEGDVADAIAKASFPYCNVPCSDWSLHNRFLVFLSGTADARGFRQWKSAGRKVVKGAKAVYILAPRFLTDRDVEPDAEGKHSQKLIGFRGVPVFRAEDTEGEPLDYEQITLPAHPLLEVAAAWGIQVRAMPGNDHFYGSFSPSAGEICLASPDEQVFFHELAHAADARSRDLKGGQHPDQEIVAQLGAEVLARLVGRQLPNEGHSYEYVANYAAKWFPKATKEDAIRKACHRVLRRTCQVIEAILDAAANIDEEAACSSPPESDPPEPDPPSSPAPAAAAEDTSVSAPCPRTEPALNPIYPVEGALSISPPSAPAAGVVASPQLPTSPTCRSEPITVGAQILKRVLTALKKIVDKDHQHVRLVAEGDLLVQVAGEGGAIGAEVALPCDGHGEFEVCVGLQELVRTIQSPRKKDLLTLDCQGEHIRVGHNGVQTSVPALTLADDAPMVPRPNGAEETLAKVSFTSPATDYTLAAMSRDETRSTITCLRFEAGEIISTDGHRLHRCAVEGRVNSAFSLPASVSALAAKLQDLLERRWITVRRGEGITVVHTPLWQITTTTEEQAFPAYGRVLPKREKLPVKVTVALGPLKRTLKAAKKVAMIKVEINGAIELSWSSLATDTEGRASVGHIDHAGPNTFLFFDPRYLLDAFDLPGKEAVWHLPAPDPEVSAEAPLGACLIESADGTQSAVVMPCRG